MYQSLYSTMKPLIYDGKSGKLVVTNQNKHQAVLYLKEGLLEQAVINKLSGKKASMVCAQWLSISTTFDENSADEYSMDPEIDTNAFLVLLEKIEKNVQTINKTIEDSQVILLVDQEKLHKSSKLKVEDMKMALLFNGQRTIEEVQEVSGKSEYGVLVRACNLLLSGVARKVALKNPMPAEKQEIFLEELTGKLAALVGPVSTMLVNGGFQKIGATPESLAYEDVSLLLDAVSAVLEGDDRTAFNLWRNEEEKAFLSK